MVTVLDGGMGSELNRRGDSPGTKLWSAQALLDAPEAVSAVHDEFIEAGAEIIITNTYSTIPSYLGKSGLAERYLELAGLAGKLARESADDAQTTQRKIQVAGALPPLDESYRADLVPEDDVARPIYRALANTLAPFVDLFVCETMSCAREAVNAAEAAVAEGGGKPVWVSWTLDERPGHGLRSGESIFDAVAKLEHLPIDAFLFNCTSPETITQGLNELAMLTDKPRGAYPNRMHVPPGWTLDNDISVEVRPDLGVDEFVAFAQTWIADGASIVGGCCGLGPEFIRALTASLQTA